MKPASRARRPWRATEERQEGEGPITKGAVTTASCVAGVPIVEADNAMNGTIKKCRHDQVDAMMCKIGDEKREHVLHRRLAEWRRRSTRPRRPVTTIWMMQPTRNEAGADHR